MTIALILYYKTLILCFFAFIGGFYVFLHKNEVFFTNSLQKNQKNLKIKSIFRIILKNFRNILKNS